MEITGAVALVTGANRGLGLAFAQGLLEAGAEKVYAGVRDPESVTDPNLIPIQLDVTDAEQVKAAAEKLTDVNLVINNAGVASVATPLSTDIEDARRQFDVNVLGVLRVAQAFAPQLENGALVNMLSVASFRPLLNLGTYAASKAAAWSLTSSLREELTEHAGRRRPRRIHRHRHGGLGPRRPEDLPATGRAGDAASPAERRNRGARRRGEPRREGRTGVDVRRKWADSC